MEPRRTGRGQRVFGAGSVMTRLSIVVALLLAGRVGAAGAQGNDASPVNGTHSMPRFAVSYRPVPFSELPGWAADDHAEALRAFLRSCDRLVAATRSGAGAATSPPAAGLIDLCGAAAALAGTADRGRARAFFEQHFTPHAMLHDGPSGLLTGYYEPVLEASREPAGEFKIAILRRPADLVNLVDESERAAAGHGLTHARRTATGTEPYATRAEIDAGALAGQGLELAYLADPVDLFFLQVQGSGQLAFRDGTTVRIGYAGKNGHPYTSIGRSLIDEGAISAEAMSLAALAEWLRADPARGRQVMWRNASYVFFRELSGAEAASPLGVWDIPLTPGRSLAVDTATHALGTPIYVAAPTLTDALAPGAFQRLMIAQDVGSAIRGPERGDIFFGSGPAAGALAGVTKHAGTFYVLRPRALSETAATAKAAP